jgi:uncharacterized membrane protein YgcG
MNKKTKWTLLALVLLLLISAAAWAFWTPGEDPQITKIHELRAQIEAAPSEERRALFGQMREEFQKLSPEARDALFADRRQEWQSRQRKRMGEFFAMSYAQQIASIDKEIDDRERRRARREQSQGSSGGRPNFQGQGGGPGGGPPGGGPGGPGGRGGGGDRASDPVQRRKDFLDNTTPIERAQMAAHREMVQQRRTQRGM